MPLKVSSTGSIQEGIAPAHRGTGSSPDIAPAHRGTGSSPDIAPAHRGTGSSPDIAPAPRGTGSIPDGIAPAHGGTGSIPDGIAPAHGGTGSIPDGIAPAKSQSKAAREDELDAFVEDIVTTWNDGSISKSEVRALIKQAGEDAEKQAYLYLALVKRGDDFEVDAEATLRKFLRKNGAQEPGSPLAIMIKKVLPDESNAAPKLNPSQAAFLQHLGNAMSDQHVSQQEALVLIAKASGDVVKQALLYVGLINRGPQFSADGATAIRIFLEENGANDHGSELTAMRIRVQSGLQK